MSKLLTAHVEVVIESTLCHSPHTLHCCSQPHAIRCQQPVRRQQTYPAEAVDLASKAGRSRTTSHPRGGCKTSPEAGRNPHTHLFGIESLRLDRLTAVRRRSSFGHYLFDFTSPLVFLLRSIKGVRRSAFVCNQARVERHSRTWYNRVVGSMMMVDHLERYVKTPSQSREKVCVGVGIMVTGRRLSVSRSRPRQGARMRRRICLHMAPFMEEWKVSEEHEEWNPDTRIRNGAWRELTSTSDLLTIARFRCVLSICAMRPYNLASCVMFYMLVVTPKISLREESHRFTGMLKF